MSDAPAPPATSLVALRDRREQVIAQLTDAFGQGEFEVEELERRLDLAHAASSLAELTPLVADLAAPATTTALVPASAAAVERAARGRACLGAGRRRGLGRRSRNGARSGDCGPPARQ